MSSKILLVDDDPQSLESTRKILELNGYEVSVATDGQNALEKMRDNRTLNFDLVVTDVRMPRLGGLEFLRALSLYGDTVPVILMTAYGRVEDAVWAMKLGAVDFLTKPFKRQTLLSSVESALKRRHAKIQDRGTGVSGKTTLLGNSSAMQNLKSVVQQVSRTNVNVLLLGESGTGKELVARRLHEESLRVGGKFIALNCAAVPEQLMESELFGFEKGSFTGATGAREGLFEAANGGTLLLDEIGDMPISLQAKLLRVLQEREVRRIGSNVSKKIDVRVIAATHKDLKQEIQVGHFREDLWYRLEVVSIAMPPLRDRREDIPELAAHFLQTASQRHGKNVNSIDEVVLALLMRHSWPGNVRELSNVIERAVVFTTGDRITVGELPPHLLADIPVTENLGLDPRFYGGAESAGYPGASTISVPLGTSLRDVEDLLIRKTLEATAGDKNMTAKLLGINSRTIYRKLDSKKLEGEPTPEN